LQINESELRAFSSHYLKLLTEDYKTINLTRIDDSEEFYHKQILDSVLPLKESKTFLDSLQKNGCHVDIGFGGGFPILPLAKLLPKIDFYGFDARAKKANVVSEIAIKLGIENASLRHARLEDIFFDKNVSVSFKAVGKIHEFLNMFNTNKKIEVFFYKGPNYNELEDIDSVLNKWDLIEEASYDVEGTEGRVLLGFRNKSVLHGTSSKKFFTFSSLQQNKKKI